MEIITPKILMANSNKTVVKPKVVGKKPTQQHW